MIEYSSQTLFLLNRDMNLVNIYNIMNNNNVLQDTL